MTHPRPVRAAFTLIELLVVIAIIALLIGILLPALGQARELGKKVVCNSNQRQIATATFLYRDDNNGLGWRAANGAYIQHPQTLRIYDTQWIESRINVPASWQLLMGSLVYWGVGYAEYMESAFDVYRCPKETSMDTDWSFSAADGLADGEYEEYSRTGSYGLNGFNADRLGNVGRFNRFKGKLAQFTTQVPQSDNTGQVLNDGGRLVNAKYDFLNAVDKVDFPDKLIFAQDAWEHKLDDNGDMNHNLRQYVGSTNRFNDFADPNYYRHFDRTEVLFFDGHAGELTRQQEGGRDGGAINYDTAVFYYGFEVNQIINVP